MSFVLNYIKIPIKIPILRPVQVYYFLIWTQLAVISSLRMKRCKMESLIENIKVCRSALLHFLPFKSQWNASL